MRDPVEDDMVRHEAAEALGGVASEDDAEEGIQGGSLFETEEDRVKGVLGILKEWSTMESAPMVVRESCQVALDMYEVSVVDSENGQQT
jgi:deoxyhypusine monooxygenase